MDSLAALLKPEAERLAREEWETCARIKGLSTPWLDVNPGGRDLLVATHLALLADLSRPASRDALVRWGIEREMERYDAEPMPSATDEQRAWMRRTCLAVADEKWHALRDDAEGLERAVLALAGEAR